MIKYLSLLVGGTILMVSSTAMAETYTAAALSDEGVYAIARTDSPNDAIMGALKKCQELGGQDCYVPKDEDGEHMVGDAQQSISVAISVLSENREGPTIGVGIGNTVEDAEDAALDSCLDNGGSVCEVKNTLE